jgi:hypothetical protein
VLHVRLDLGRVEFAANQTLGIKHGVGGVHGDLVLGGITDKTLSVIESDVRRGGTLTLVVGNDLHTIVLPHTNARVRGTKIDTDLRFSAKKVRRGKRMK